MGCSLARSFQTHPSFCQSADWKHAVLCPPALSELSSHVFSLECNFRGPASPFVPKIPTPTLVSLTRPVRGNRASLVSVLWVFSCSLAQLLQHPSSDRSIGPASSPYYAVDAGRRVRMRTQGPDTVSLGASYQPHRVEHLKQLTHETKLTLRGVSRFIEILASKWPLLCPALPSTPLT